MCHPDLGYQWKYAIRDPVEGRALRHEEDGETESAEEMEEEFDVGWTLSRHGHSLEHPLRRIQGVNIEDDEN